MYHLFPQFWQIQTVLFFTFVFDFPFDLPINNHNPHVQTIKQSRAIPHKQPLPLLRVCIPVVSVVTITLSDWHFGHTIIFPLFSWCFKKYMLYDTTRFAKSQHYFPVLCIFSAIFLFCKNIWLICDLFGISLTIIQGLRNFHRSPFYRFINYVC